jgi:hypothetical protein
MTRQNPESNGVPALPIEGGTRFSAGTSDMLCNDYIYDTNTGTLFAIMELDPGVSLSDMPFRIAEAASGLTNRLRFPASKFDSDQTTTSRSGRTVFSGAIYHIKYIGLLLFDHKPVDVQLVK